MTEHTLCQSNLHLPLNTHQDLPKFMAIRMRRNFYFLDLSDGTIKDGEKLVMIIGACFYGVGTDPTRVEQTRL